MQVMLGFSFAFGWFVKVYVSYGTFCFACGCNSYPSLRVVSFLSFFIEVLLGGTR